ncbi:MAG: efflux RND transporter periplasmic adaptor subunit [Pseudomonadota bacterium]
MRVFPIIAAIAFAAVIYVLVLDRDLLTGGTQVEDALENSAETAQSTDPETQSATQPIGVLVVRSVARETNNAVTVRGETRANREVELRSETSGLVVSEPLRKGNFVEEGDVLCELGIGTRGANLAEAVARLAEAEARVPEALAQVPESEARVEESRARVIEANARLREAEINNNAAKRLNEGGFASETRVAQTEAEVEGAKAQIVSAEASLKAALSGLERVAAGIEAARAGVESAEASVAAAEKEIDRITIKAPFSGLLETDSAEIGSLLQLGGLCATVMELNPIILVGFIPETDIDKVTLGARASARLASGKEISGKVVFISRASDSTTRTFQVDIRVENNELKLRDGQTAEISIEADGTKAHLLPQSALTLSDSGDLGVRVVTSENIAEFVPVSLLRDTPTGVYLTGLADKADVIVIGQEFVADGVPVAPAYQEISQ